eukprot:TRINITY_DN11846_c3_g1_i13.p2 TRINITY_DN11846_c3_g1~~TRINITY_DN11846_c3_g1_i13.p2  ORF type:complete len:120 (+),score=22.16 TRINITY_DN11846_c3_g1_i13:3531-3890(+)
MQHSSWPFINYTSVWRRLLVIVISRVLQSRGRIILLVQLLKTEIRQEERADARDPLNLEYLKNVILQFLMKQEERPQLVPVLAMLLQFSPEEHRQLQQFQVEPATASEGSAWNSYFPRF